MNESDDFESEIEEGFEEATIPDKDVQGIFLVQLLILSNFNDESCSIYDNVYLQLTNGRYIKRTHVMPFLTHKEVIIDAVKHFPVNVPVSRNSIKSSNLKIEMIMYKANKDKSISIEKRQMGVMLFHLKDIMSGRTITGSHEFSKDMTSMAKLEMKICFAYGMFGFGYSRRINYEPESYEDEYPANLEDQLLLSLFPRYKPPPDRVDEKVNGILSVKDVPIPDILPMFHDQDDPSGDKFIDPSKWENHQCASLMKDCERLRRLRLLLLSCDSYHLRKIFLEKLILNNQELTFADIKRYKAQKEEDSDNLNALMKAAESMGRLNEKKFVRRLSSSVNPDEIKKVLLETDKKLLSKLNQMDSDASVEGTDERRVANVDLSGAFNQRPGPSYR